MMLLWLSDRDTDRSALQSPPDAVASAIPLSDIYLLPPRDLLWPNLRAEQIRLPLQAPPHRRLWCRKVLLVAAIRR
jgi:hypothetical protein